MLSPEVVKKAVNAIKNQATYEYFFNKISSPDWIIPLWNKGFFKESPEIIQQDNYIRFPVWVESEYLVKMASLAPQTVAEVALSIPDTDNIRVHEDIVDITLNIPANLAMNFVPKIKQWLDSPYLLLLPEKVAELMVKLAKEGETDSALDLMKTLLQIFPRQKREDNDEFYFSVEPRIRFKYFEYGQILKNCIPDLVSLIGQPVLEVLINLLSNAISFTQNPKIKQDNSYQDFIWRHYRDSDDIEDDSSPYPKVEKALRIAVRNTAKQIIISNPDNLALIVSLLQQQHWLIFHKIALYLLNEFSDIDYDLVNNSLLNCDYFDLSIGKLSYSNVVNKNRIEASFIGIKSPKTSDELIELSQEELVYFLKNWQPISQDIFTSPSISGLEAELRQATEKRSLYFASIAEKFQELNPRYSVALLTGLSNVFRDKATQEKQQLNDINWLSILNLCNWIVTSSQEWRKNHSPISPDWREPRKAVLDLISIGLQLDNTLEIPFQFRETVWNLLFPLTQDADPTPEYENNYITLNNKSENNYNIRTLLLNTIRSKAIYTVINYALWVRRHHKNLPNKEELIKQGFKAMTEVIEVLEGHLDINKEPSLAVHAVYGYMFPNLTYLDENWTIKNLVKIFPREKHLELFRCAAWETYLTCCQLYISMYQILQDEYLYAVENLNSTENDLSDPTEPQQGLIKHLMILYWWGDLILYQPDSLLTKFYENASGNLRGYAIEFIGRSLSNTEEKIPSELLERLLLLWEKRINEAKQSNKIENYTKELSAFSWWFKSEQFDNKWSIKQLKQVLNLINKVDDLEQYQIMPILIKLVDNMSIEVIECLNLIVKKSDDIYLKKDEVKMILNSVIKGNNEEGKTQAIDIINYLMYKHKYCWEFGELLPKIN